MLEREQLVSELNQAQSAVAELRSAEEVDSDALAAAIVKLEAVRSELGALDARQAPALIVPAQPKRPTSFTDELRESGVIDRAVAGQFGTTVVQRDVFTGTGVSGAQDILTPMTDEVIDRRPRTVQNVLDLLPVRSTGTDQVKYFIQTNFANAAAVVPRRTGSNFGSYAESDLSVEPRTANVVKVGHYVRTDADSLADAGQLQALIEDELAWGIRSVVEAQLLSPTNTAQGLPSLLADAQTGTYAAGASGAELIDAVREAKRQAEVALLPADFVIMDPASFMAIEVSKNASGSYLGNGPFGGANGQLWGLTPVVSQTITPGTIVVGSTRGVTLFSRRQTEVSVSTETADDFLRDAVRVKASARLALVNRRPECVVVLTAEGSGG
jgi:HK97 family phage major capsid protein